MHLPASLHAHRPPCSAPTAPLRSGPLLVPFIPHPTSFNMPHTPHPSTCPPSQHPLPHTPKPLPSPALRNSTSVFCCSALNNLHSVLITEACILALAPIRSASPPVCAHPYPPLTHLATPFNPPPPSKLKGVLNQIELKKNNLSGDLMGLAEARLMLVSVNDNPGLCGMVPAGVRFARGYNPANTRLGQPCD